MLLKSLKKSDWINNIFDLIFPKYCIVCQKLGWSYLCLNCLRKVKLESNIYCPKYQCKRVTGKGNYCPEHRRKSRSLTGVLALSNYKNKVIKELIHYLKYEGVKELADEINKLNLTNIDQQIVLKNSILIPVPLHPKRENQRGYNQSLEIAQIYSKYFNIPIENDLVKRVRNTKSQMQIEYDEEREENIKESFEFKDKKTKILKNKTVYLVDDVTTSGATLQEMAKTLKTLKYPPRRIYGLVLAKR